jgi:hypothetical protein
VLDPSLDFSAFLDDLKHPHIKDTSESQTMVAIDTNTRRLKGSTSRWAALALAALSPLTRKNTTRMETRHLSDHMKRDIGLIDSHDPRKRR